MRWDHDDIVEHLLNDYCIHYNKRDKYLKNDNEVDADYEGAQCDYIFDLLVTITEGSPTDVADRIDDRLEGVFEFDPEMPVASINKDYYSAQDILYSDYESFRSMFSDEDADFLLKEVMYVDGDYDVYIPKGTRMTYKGPGKDAGGWPIFDIHGFELDFGGAPFKLKGVE